MHCTNEITAEQVETAFALKASSGRFANFCNAVIVAEGIAAISNPPVLCEKPGADGSFDGEWEVALRSTATAENPFGRVGWNLFQFKARGISGSGRRKAISSLKSSLKGTILELVDRVKPRKRPEQYVLFTNLQLGLQNESTTIAGALLSRDRAEIESAIRDGYAPQVSILIVDSALLASLVNKHHALRLTYFSGPAARSWDEKWTEELSAKDYKASISLIARDQEREILSKWISDETTRVVALCGPSGIGKSRLALETTRTDRWRTSVVDVVEDFQKWGLGAFNTSPQPQLVIIEDPDEKQAEYLAKQAVAVKGVKLIFTFPSESDAPSLKLVEHDAVKKLMLQPLSKKQSEDLLSAAGATFDRNALDWIVLQAGGNPEILLSAASSGRALREESGSLKSNLVDLYQKRIERKLGIGAMVVLRLVSPLQWVKITGETDDIAPIIASFQATMTQPTILDQLKRLEGMGYVRRRGNHIMVVPPLFAAALTEEVFKDMPNSVCALFDRLGDSSRKRFLERVVTTDLEEESQFWNHIFEEALGNLPRLTANLDLLDYLARAVPRRTARFLAERIDELSKHAHAVLATLRELAYHQETCALGMSMLQALALREPWEKRLYSDHQATKKFCECFVHWYFDFPMSYQDREQWVRGMLESGHLGQIRLAARVVVMVTNPPSFLSGYSASARKLGSAPQPRLLREVFDYVDRFVELRFELTQSKDHAIVALSQDGFAGAFQELRRFLAPDRLIQRLEQFMDWSEAGKINADARDMRTAIRWLQEEYTTKSKEPTQVDFAERWREILRRLETLRQRLDEGPFILRLQLSLGGEYDNKWEELNGKRLYGFEKRCHVIAKEAIADPGRMTSEAWDVVSDPKSQQAHIFILALGEHDEERKFLPYVEAQVGRRQGDHTFGLYLLGMQGHSPRLVEERLSELAQNESFPKSAILAAIKLVGPTPGNRARLQKVIRDRSVQPLEVAGMFMAGRWLENVPVEEIRVILEFVASEPKEWPKWIIGILSLHLSVVKSLPTELTPIALGALQNADPSDIDKDWDWGQVANGVARGDVDKAFELLASQIRELANAKALDREIKMHRFQSRGPRDLRTYLCVNHPERTCQELLTLKQYVSRLENTLNLPFDLDKSLPLLLKIAAESEANAVFLAGAISGAQKGFFPFAYGLMDAYGKSAILRSTLGSRAVYQTGNGVEWDFNQALDAIKAELSNPETPMHHLPWLKEIELKIRRTPTRSSFFGEETHGFLGWD